MHSITKKILSYFLIDEQTKYLKDDFYPYFYKINEIVNKELIEFKKRNPHSIETDVFLSPQYYEVFCIKIPGIFEAYHQLNIEQRFSKQEVSDGKNNFELLQEQIHLIKIKIDELYDQLYKIQQDSFIINHQVLKDKEAAYQENIQEQSVEMIDVEFDFKKQPQLKPQSIELIAEGRKIFEDFKKNHQGSFEDGFIEKAKKSDQYWQTNQTKKNIQEEKEILKEDNKMKFIVIGVIFTCLLLFAVLR